MSIEAIVNEFSAVAANPKGQLKAYKDAGKKCIGVMPYYAPEELVYAAGMMPFGMWGSNDKTEQRSKEYCATFSPSSTSRCCLTARWICWTALSPRPSATRCAP